MVTLFYWWSKLGWNQNCQNASSDMITDYTGRQPNPTTIRRLHRNLVTNKQ